MKRRAHKKQAHPARKQDEHRSALAERLDAEREKLFKAMSVVAVVRAGCKSVEMERDPELAVDALQAAYDILDQAAGELQVIGNEHGGGR